MQAQRLETTDLFKSAVFLCHGGRLAGMRFRQRRIVSFLIEGEDILQVDLAYRNGSAQVNACELRQTLNHLRDALFTRLRDARERGDDRKRENRCDQARGGPGVAGGVPGSGAQADR